MADFLLCESHPDNNDFQRVVFKEVLPIEKQIKYFFQGHGLQQEKGQLLLRIYFTG